MASTISGDVESQVKALIDAQRSGATAPVTAWNDVKEILVTNKIAYYMTIHSSLVMVHKANRGGLGVNAYNMNRNGARIMKSGVSIDELEKAVVEELSSDPQMRAEQVAFNVRLIQNSANMLAKLKGGERFASLGTGHTIQFFRAAAAQCVTPEKELQDLSGKLNPHAMSKKDHRFGQASQDGWKMLVLPSQCGKVWPMIADLAQRALNGGNNVASQSTELEIARTIAGFWEHSKDADFQQCIDGAAMNSPPCSPYIDKVCGMSLFGFGFVRDFENMRSIWGLLFLCTSTVKRKGIVGELCNVLVLGAETKRAGFVHGAEQLDVYCPSICNDDRGNVYYRRVGKQVCW